MAVPGNNMSTGDGATTSAESCSSLDSSLSEDVGDLFVFKPANGTAAEDLGDLSEDSPELEES